MSLQRLMRGSHSVLRSTLYHPLGNLLLSSPFPQREGQEPKTALLIWQNDNHQPWGLSYLTQGGLQRHAGLLWPADGQTLLCNFKERWRGLGEGRGSTVMKSCGYREWQVNGGGKKTPEPSHFLIKHSRLWLQHVMELQMSIMQLDVVWGATRWTCIKSMEPQEISDYFVRLPLQWLGFCNQRMQIRIWQPINHIPAVMYWAARHVPADMVQSPFALRHLSTEGIRKILGTFHFHLHFSGRVGRLSQESSVSGAAEQLWASLFCLAGKQFEIKLLWGHVFWFTLRSQCIKCDVYIKNLSLISSDFTQKCDDNSSKTVWNQ